MRSAWIKIAFVIPVLWWVYLFFTTQFIVVYDAEGFEQTAKSSRIMVGLIFWKRAAA